MWMAKTENCTTWSEAVTVVKRLSTSDVLEVESESLNKMEGVEVHLKEDCNWVQSEMSKFFWIIFF